MIELKGETRTHTRLDYTILSRTLRRLVDSRQAASYEEEQFAGGEALIERGKFCRHETANSKLKRSSKNHV